MLNCTQRVEKENVASKEREEAIQKRKEVKFWFRCDSVVMQAFNCLLIRLTKPVVANWLLQKRQHSALPRIVSSRTICSSSFAKATFVEESEDSAKAGPLLVAASRLRQRPKSPLHIPWKTRVSSHATYSKSCMAMLSKLMKVHPNQPDHGDRTVLDCLPLFIPFKATKDFHGRIRYVRRQS